VKVSVTVPVKADSARDRATEWVFGMDPATQDKRAL
jgi:hypothetical protein